MRTVQFDEYERKRKIASAHFVSRIKRYWHIVLAHILMHFFFVTLTISLVVDNDLTDFSMRYVCIVCEHSYYVINFNVIKTKVREMHRQLCARDAI